MLLGRITMLMNIEYEKESMAIEKVFSTLKHKVKKIRTRNVYEEINAIMGSFARIPEFYYTRIYYYTIKNIIKKAFY